MAEHHPAGSESLQPHTEQSSRPGPEPSSVHADVYVWSYALLVVHARTEEDFGRVSTYPCFILYIVSKWQEGPSVLWLGSRKGIRPVKTGAGMVICLEQGADLHMAQLMPLPLTVSCFSEIQIGFSFLASAYLGRPGKRAVKRVCVLCLNGT